jgi:hypothetical protein
MKYVIARNDGPKSSQGSYNGKLVPGHKYEVVCAATHDTKERFELLNNPRDPVFYIKVKDDTDVNSWSMWHTGEYTYWNDYFLSTEEIRELKLDGLLNEL